MAPATRKKPAKRNKVKARRVTKPPEPPPEAVAAKPHKGPIGYTLTLAEDICHRLANGETLTKICSDAGMPTVRAVMKWVQTRKDFAAAYAESRKLQLQYWADETVDIADDGTNDRVVRETKSGALMESFNREYFERSRLRVETRKWFLSKLVDKYRDRTTLQGGDKPIEIKVEERNALIDSICALIAPKDDGKTKPTGAKDEPRER